MAGIKEKEPEVAMRLISDPSVQINADGSTGEPRITPWRAFFRNGPVRIISLKASAVLTLLKKGDQTYSL